MANIEAPHQEGGAHLARQIGLWSAVAVVVGSTIGSGIFRTPSEIATKLPGPLPMLAVWLVGGLFVLCGALTLAEVGGAFPYSGGLYVFVREAYGRLPGFLFGWAQLIVIRPSSIGAVAIVFGEYALQVTGRQPGDPGFGLWAGGLAIVAIIVVGWANVRGVRFGTGIQNVTTVLKTGGLLVLVLLALGMALPQSGGHFTPMAPAGSFGLAAFGLALVNALWAYDGWADCSYVGGEMVDPKRNLPKAILYGTGIVIAVYLLANVAYLAVFSPTEMSASKIIAADTMSKLVGAGGVVFIVATVMLSTFGTVNGSLLTSPRIFYALAEDDLFFRPVAKVHPTYRTPYVSVVITSLLGIGYVVVATLLSGSGAFIALTDAFVIAMVPFYALAVASVFVFRNRQGRLAKEAEASGDAGELPDSLLDPQSQIPNPQSEFRNLQSASRAYLPSVRTPLYPATPLLFVVSTLFLLVNSLVQESSRKPTVITLGLVLVGIPVYYMTFGRKPS